MAEFYAIDHENINNFSSTLEKLTQFGEWTVISSNAYPKDGTTYYYALLEKPGVFDQRYKLLDTIESIKSDTSSIEDNTRT